MWKANEYVYADMCIWRHTKRTVMYKQPWQKNASHYYWQPATCYLQELQLSLFFELLRNRDILVLGDSLLHQTSTAPSIFSHFVKVSQRKNAVLKNGKTEFMSNPNLARHVVAKCLLLSYLQCDTMGRGDSRYLGWY